MKIRGGHMPKIAGRPQSVVDELDVAASLSISLLRGGIQYRSLIAAGQAVTFGDPLAEADAVGGKLGLPSPVSGTVKSVDDSIITITTGDTSTKTDRYTSLEPQRVTAEVMREVLAKAGVWPLIWSSKTGGMPALDGSEQPKAIVVNCVQAEPFRARGKVILQHAWYHVVRGIRFLPRLLADYGTVDVVLTAKNDPVVRMLYVDVAGHAWIHFHMVPLRYPVENPIVLSKALKKESATWNKDDVVWVIDAQGAEAVGACLADGMPLHKRVVAVGGPGHPQPRHVCARIGTPVKDILSTSSGEVNAATILRGGLMVGEPIEPASESLQYDDDAFFCLPGPGKREFLSFVQPGFDRASVLPCFASRLTGGEDKRVSTLLRGEPRPCIACGLCEKQCPVGLMPQVLHRYLYNGSVDEADAAGLDLCTDCNLCAYVCPSKIDLRGQFAEAREQLRVEREEAEEARAKEEEAKRQAELAAKAEV